MEFSATSAAPSRHQTDCAIVGIYHTRRLSQDAAALDRSSRKTLSSALKAGDANGKLGTVRLITKVSGVSCKRVLLVGLGKKNEFGERQLRTAMDAAMSALAESGAARVTCYLTREKVRDLDVYGAGRIAALAAGAAAYRFEELKSKKQPANKLREITFAVADDIAVADIEIALRHAEAINEGMNLARDLGNRPANVCTPGHLADTGRDLDKRFKSITTKVIDRAGMKRLGMGSFLSVTAGAAAPPQLVVMEYKNGGDSAPIALVGKGITFDSGGISIKPAPSMDEMKFDMCGAASVFGTMLTLAKLRLPLNVVGIVPACENMPSGTATHPGDIVETMSGQTVEILNTDAEGRLILCDAITYARQFEPDTVIDIATLTGACVIALGAYHTGLMTPEQALADELLDAGRAAGDVAWQLPLTEDYATSLKSNFADFANVGGKPGGAITAGCFLQKFADGLRWAHLDIAGSAWNSGDKKGATGRPVGLLSQYLLNRAQAE